MAISSDRVIHHIEIASAFNKETFLEFLKELVPKLHPCQKYILMDNVAFHHSKIIIEFLESKHLKPLFCPAYSPQYNPIEEVFSSLKRQFRKLFIMDAPDMNFKTAVQQSIQNIASNYSTRPHYIHSFRTHASQASQASQASHL